MNPRLHRSGRGRSRRHAASHLCLLAALLLVAAAGHLPHSHASASLAIFNEQHVLENPAARGADVPLTPTSSPCFIAVVIAETSAPDDRALAPASGRHHQSRAPPSA